MNEVWANRLTAGTKKWSEVPGQRKDAVKAVLAVRRESGSITAELYSEIVGRDDGQ